MDVFYQMTEKVSDETAEVFRSYTPFSFWGYFFMLAIAYVVRMLLSNILGLTKDQKLVPDFIVNLHNYFMVVQSLFLAVIVSALYFDTARIMDANLPQDALSVMLSPERMKSKLFEFCLVCFVASKLYEGLDTVILILNSKPTITLHVWHHATTYMAFYTGLYSGAGFWIGFLNSMIHVVMYLYYAKCACIKPLAKNITYTQIFHLSGGVALNFLTAFVYTWGSNVSTPEVVPMNFVKFAEQQIAHIPVLGEAVCNLLNQVAQLMPRQFTTDPFTCSVLNLFFCGSYATLFVFFFTKKYKKKKRE